MSSWQLKGLPAMGLRSVLWILVASAFLLSYALYSPSSGAREGAADWIFRSWPALLAAGLAMWLLLKGPLATAHGLLQKGCRLAMFFFLYCGFLYILKWNPFWKWMLTLGFENRNKTEGFLILVSTLVWLVMTFRVLFGFRSPGGRFNFGIPALTRASVPEMKTTRPNITFADVGGMEEAKRQIREIVENRLSPGKFNQFGVVRNGILLYGPQGSGKTLLAEATAGEFKINFRPIKGSELLSMWVGETERVLRKALAEAASNRPVVVFFDEIDVLGAARNTGVSPTTGTRSWNNITIQLMQCMDEYRSTPGLILMAATNLLEGLDPALVREGRFDSQVRVDLPDEPTRKQIFEVQLKRKPWNVCPLDEFAQRTPGASAAKIKSIVDRAALIAAKRNRRIEYRDLQLALDETGGKDRPYFQTVQWEDLIVEADVEKELRTLIRQLNADWSVTKGITLPMGILLVGPPGTGKTMIGRLIATQTKRSFYPLSAADILGGQVGASVKKLSEAFARARENSPSILFFDEIDGLLPASSGMLNIHDTQLVEQCRTEISRLEPENDVLLIGATNYLDRVDSAIRRGGRFSEKIEIGLPSPANRERLLRKYLRDLTVQVDPTILVDRLAGLSPADLEAICKAAARHAFGRGDRDDHVPPLNFDDFEHAIRRVSTYTV